MSPLLIRYRAPAEVHDNPANSRRHTPQQIRQIASSIRAFGFNVPLLVDGSGMVVCGHGRLAAAKLLEMANVPTISLEHLSEPQRRAFVIADNRLAELSTWDDAVLAIELEQLQAAISTSRSSIQELRSARSTPGSAACTTRPTRMLPTTWSIRAAFARWLPLATCGRSGSTACSAAMRSIR